MHVLGCRAHLGIQLLDLLGLVHDLGAEHLAELRQFPQRALYAARALHAQGLPSQAESRDQHGIRAQPSPSLSLGAAQKGHSSTGRKASALWSRKHEAGRSWGSKQLIEARHSTRLGLCPPMTMLAPPLGAGWEKKRPSLLCVDKVCPRQSMWDHFVGHRQLDDLRDNCISGLAILLAWFRLESSLTRAWFSCSSACCCSGGRAAKALLCWVGSKSGLYVLEPCTQHESSTWAGAGALQSPRLEACPQNDTLCLRSCVHVYRSSSTMDLCCPWRLGTESGSSPSTFSWPYRLRMHVMMGAFLEGFRSPGWHWGARVSAGAGAAAAGADGSARCGTCQSWSPPPAASRSGSAPAHAAQYPQSHPEGLCSTFGPFRDPVSTRRCPYQLHLAWHSHAVTLPWLNAVGTSHMVSPRAGRCTTPCRCARPCGFSLWVPGCPGARLASRRAMLSVQLRM